MRENPRRVEWPLTRLCDCQSMRLEGVNEAARRFLGGPRVYTFIARPRK